MSNTHVAASLARAMAWVMYAACADPELASVQYEPGRAVPPWKAPASSEPRDAGHDAGHDAAPSLRTPDAADGMDWEDAGAQDLDAGADIVDAGESKDAATEAPPTVTACDFSVTTKPLGGRYAPKNIGAIWVERDDGVWVKTLAVWARTRLRYLTSYLAANTTRDKTDAITSATLRQHETHDVRWNLTDAAGETVPEGDYRIRVEVTDHDNTGEVLTVPFTKSDATLKLTPKENAHFADISLNCE